MRCLCCNRNLSDAESTARHPINETFLDMCFPCLREIGISPLVREDIEDTVVDYDDFEYNNWIEDEE
jgi:hypothetical protein